METPGVINRITSQDRHQKAPPKKGSAGEMKGEGRAVGVHILGRFVRA